VQTDTDRIANYLVYDYWHEYAGTRPRKFPPNHPTSPDAGDQMALSYYISDLVPDRVEDAIHRAADEWSKATGIQFFEQDHIGAQISVWMNSDWQDRTFTIWDTNERDGDFDDIWSSSIVFNNSYILSSDQVLYETALEEWGHTLGLGHAGPYNGTDGGPIFANDMHSVTIMSYTSDVRVSGLGPADYAAAAILYDAGLIATGDDIYDIKAPLFSFLKDDGGFDVARLWASQESRVFDMRPGYGNKAVAVAEGTVIENVQIMTPDITTAVVFEDRIEVHLAGWELIVGDGGWTLTFDNWSWGA